MQVKEIMTDGVTFCGPNATLAEVAIAMWDKDCGAIPVVNQDKKVVGIITDRDICMTVVMRNRLASEITANDLIGGLVRVCSPEDDIETALAIMEHSQLRRLPVVDKEGTLCGILSINDAIRHTSKEGKKSKRVSRKSVLKTLRAISEKRLHKETKEESEQEEELIEEVLSDEKLTETTSNETTDEEQS